MYCLCASCLRGMSNKIIALRDVVRRGVTLVNLSQTIERSVPIVWHSGTILARGENSQATPD